MHHRKQSNVKPQPEASKNVLRNVIAISFILQATFIGIRGNLDVLSGKPVLDVLPGMITRGIELIIKAQGVQKRLQKRDRNTHSERSIR